MLKNLKKRTEGFTIIEVMIVLAIAGLIILIVLLAIPALQRNGRNTAIKNDASAVAAGISEYKSNNDGKSPNDISSDDGGKVTIKGTGDTNSEAKVQAGTTVDDAGSDNPEVGTVSVKYSSKCEGDGGARSIAIHYKVETSGDPVVKCIDA